MNAKDMKVRSRLAHLSKLQKVVASAAVVTAAAGLAGFGTYANWTQSQSAQQSLTTGTFGVALGGTSPLVNNLAVTLTNVIPGDSWARAVDVSNTGSVNFSTFTVNPTGTGSATPHSLNDGTGNALTYAVYSCGSEWSTTSPTTGCAGGAGTLVSATAALTGSNSTDLSATAAETAGSVSHLLIVTGYPSTASDFANYGGLSDTITYTFSATQVAGQSR